MPSWERSPSFLRPSVVLRLQNIENLFCAITTAEANAAIGVGWDIRAAGGKTDVARHASVFVPPHPCDRLFVRRKGSAVLVGKNPPAHAVVGLGSRPLKSIMRRFAALKAVKQGV